MEHAFHFFYPYVYTNICLGAQLLTQTKFPVGDFQEWNMIVTASGKNET